MNRFTLNTERAKVRRVAAHWRAQYPEGCRNKRRLPFDPDKVYAKLKALDAETATAADVAAIIGNESWCRPDDCDQCGKTTYQTITVGEPRNYESNTATLCLACLRKAVAALEAAE